MTHNHYVYKNRLQIAGILMTKIFIRSSPKLNEATSNNFPMNNLMSESSTKNVSTIVIHRSLDDF